MLVILCCHLACNEGGEPLHKGDGLLLLPVGMPRAIPGKDKVTAHVGDDAGKEQGKSCHQNGRLPQHQQREEAVGDSEGHIMVCDHSGLVQDHDWAACCVKVGLLDLAALVDWEGDLGRYA